LLQAVVVVPKLCTEYQLVVAELVDTYPLRQ
jgi:hypothetical protein